MFEIKPGKNQPNKQPARKVHKLFEDAMDDAPSQDSGRPKLSHLVAQMSQPSHQKMLDEISKNLLEDPEIYSYDAHYDDINEKRAHIEEQKRQKTGPKYIAGIQKACEKRKIEYNMIHEKMAEKDLQREGITGGQKYVTGSYIRMMEEGKKFLQEDAAKEEYNKQHTAENKDNVLGLYKDLYKQDVFMGGYRPDLSKMVKQPQATEVKTPANQGANSKPDEQSVAAHEASKVAQKDLQHEPTTDNREERNREKRVPAENEEGRRKQERASRSRSRSKSKSPTRITSVREETETQKEPEKVLSKEEKLRLAKERYMMRKTNKPAEPNPEQP